MNIKSTNKLSALIASASLKSLEQPRNWLLRSCVICGLIFLPLTTQAVFTDTGAATGIGTTVRATDGSSGTSYTTTGGYSYGWSTSGIDSRITGSNATITTNGSRGIGVYALGNNNVIVVDGLTVVTTGENARGIASRYGSLVQVKNTQVDVNLAAAAVVAEDGGTITLDTVSIDTVDAGGIFAWNSGTVTGSNVTVNASTTNSKHTALDVLNNSAILLQDSTVRALAEGQGVIRFNRSTWTELQDDGESIIELTNVNLESAYGDLVVLNGSGTVGMATGQDRLVINGGIANVAGALINAELGYDENEHPADAVISLNEVTVTNGADLIVNAKGNNIILNANNTDLTGNITGSDSSNTSVNLDNSALDGNIQNNGEGNLTLTGSNGSVITGDVTNNGDGTLNLGLNDSSLTGNINNNNGTISSTGSSAINGDVNSSLEVSSGTLTVTGSVTVDNGQSVTGNGTLNVGGLEINDGGTLGGGLTIGTDSSERILVGLGSATLYHEFGDATETSTDTLKLGENIALDLSSIDDLSDFEFAFTDDVLDGNFTLILGEAESLENWSAEINGNIEGLTLSGQNKVTADISITLTGEGSTLTAILSNVTVTAVPEPSTYFLLGTGLGILLLAARYRRRHAQS
jgi:hypothetical protein